MSYDKINALRKYLNLFKDNGLCKICGKNVTVEERKVVAVVFNRVKWMSYLSRQ